MMVAIPLFIRRKSFIIVLLMVFVLVGSGFLFGSRAIAIFYLKVGEGNFKNGQFESAMKNLSKSHSYYPDNISVNVLLGKTFVALNRSQGDVYGPKAQEFYRISIDRFNDALKLGLNENTYYGYSDFLDAHGIAHWRLENYDKAVDILLEKIEKYPNNAFLARHLVALDYVRRQNKPEEALRIIEPAFQSQNVITELLPSAYATIMRLSTYFGNFEKTEEYAYKILNVATPTNIQSLQLAHTHLAAAHSQKGDVEKAKEFLDKADEVVNDSGRHDCLLAHFYIDNDQINLAIDVAQRRDNVRCWYALARAYNQIGRENEAKSYATMTIEALLKIPQKDIFVLRGINQMEEILQSLQ